MTVNAQQFPVAAVGWIIVMVMVLVMNRKLTEPLAAELTTAAPADVCKDFQRFGAIGLLLSFAVASSLGDDPTLTGGIRWCFF